MKLRSNMKQRNFKMMKLCSKTLETLINELNRPMHTVINDKLLFSKVLFGSPTLGHCRGSSLTHLILITAFYILDPKVTGSLVTRLGP